MFIALIGAMSAQIFLNRYHDQQLSELDTTV